MPRTVYLDHNATAPVCAAAREAVSEALRLTGNPSSVHRPGVRARQIVDQTRDNILALLGRPAAEVIFTSGGTEANNLALRGVDLPIITSVIEHDSIIEPAKDCGAKFVPVLKDGVVDLDALARTLQGQGGPALVSIMLANNETGVVQPIREAAALTHEHGGLLHCDAVQGPGKVAINMDRLGADLLTLSAHKLGGPMGVGVLVVRDGLEVRALHLGGGQEKFKRAGTHNLPGIAGFGAAASSATECAPHTRQLRDELERLCARAGAVIVGAEVARLPNTTCLSMPGVASETQVVAFDLEGIAVSAGSACSSGKIGPSHVLSAMALPQEVIHSAIRVSLGPTNSAADVERFVEVWTALNQRAAKTQVTRLAS